MSPRPSLSSLAETSGAWAFDGDDLIRLPPSEAGPAVVLVPTERVLLLSVDLPLPTRGQRLSALPFAVEDRLAEPLEQVHVALGEALGDRRYLAGAVGRGQMRAWIAAMEAGGVGRSPLVPDALTLPIPQPDTWSIRLRQGRALVRTADGAGFALAANLVAPAWAAAGQPLLMSYGEPVPDAMAAFATVADLAPLATRLATLALDLRQGAYAARGAPGLVALKRIAAVALVGVMAHAAIAAADTLAMHHIADNRRSEALALMRTVSPTTPDNADLVAELDRLLPSAGDRRSGFFPLMVRASRALQPFGAELAVRDLSYTAADGALTLQVEASDIAGLQRVAAALGSAGLAPTSGAATAGAGRADGQFVIRETAR